MNLFLPAETAVNYCEAGAKKCAYPAMKTLVLGIFAGFIVAIAGVTANTAAHSVANVGAARAVNGLIFSLALGLVVTSGAELFTGNTLITISLLERRVSASAMLRNWVLVYLGNTIGSLLVAAACAYFGQLDYSGGGLAVYTIKVAAGKCALSFSKAFVFGILCNILVTLGVLISLSAKDIAGRLLGAYVPVFLFVTSGFEHSIANLYYIPAGLFAASIPEYAGLAAEAGVNLSALTWGNFLGGNLLPVTLGNIVGGAAVGALYWFAWMKKEKGK